MAQDFAAFGKVFEPPPLGERTHLAAAFENLREHARLDCYINHREPTAQAFMPCRVSRYVVAAAPANAWGGPDLSRLQAFVARGSQAVNYRTGVWHCPLIVLDEAAKFFVLMWKDGSAADEEFVDLAEPLQFVD